MVNTIICDISIINIKFYLLKIPYLHTYSKITFTLVQVGVWDLGEWPPFGLDEFHTISNSVAYVIREFS
jgi:hypothetical protein